MGEAARGSILLVDDHLDTVRVLERLLRMSGYAVRSARTAGEALDIAAGGDCDLVISDVGLPDRSGLELVSELKRLYAVRALALSGYTADTDARAALAAGFDAHLNKPVQFEELLAAVRALLEREKR
jgi:DNA-binding response OmpR family regulator